MREGTAAKSTISTVTAAFSENRSTHTLEALLLSVQRQAFLVLGAQFSPQPFGSAIRTLSSTLRPGCTESPRRVDVVQLSEHFLSGPPHGRTRFADFRHAHSSSRLTGAEKFAHIGI